jgi:hypothetical protein
VKGAPAHVVGLWATLNAALALAIIPYGDWVLAVLLHVVGSALVAVFGIAVLVSLRRRGAGPELRLPYRSVAALAAGAVVLVLALTTVYGWWVLVLLPYPLAVALVAARRERLPADAADGTGEIDTPQRVPVERPATTDEVRAEALGIAHAQQRRRRGEAT